MEKEGTYGLDIPRRMMLLEGEDRDGGVQAEVGEEGSQNPQHTANYQTLPVTE